MGENAYNRFDTCGWTAGTGCGLKLSGKEALADAAMWAAGWVTCKVSQKNLSRLSLGDIYESDMQRIT